MITFAHRRHSSDGRASTTMIIFGWGAPPNGEHLRAPSWSVAANHLHETLPAMMLSESGAARREAVV